MASNQQPQLQQISDSSEEADQTTIVTAAGIMDRAFNFGTPGAPPSRSRSRSRTFNEFSDLNNTTKAALRRELNRERGLRQAAEEDNRYADLHLQQLHDRNRVIRGRNAELQEEVKDLKLQLDQLKQEVSQIPQLKKDLAQMTTNRDNLQTSLLHCQQQINEARGQRDALLDDKARISARLAQTMQSLEAIQFM